MRWRRTCAGAALGAAAICFGEAQAAGARFSILDYAPAGQTVDQSGGRDASGALAAAVDAANAKTAKGEPACVYVPAGTYLIGAPPPEFVRAGCVVGDGSSQSTLRLAVGFAGDLFAWSEAWEPTTPGPVVRGVRIEGVAGATHPQNALVFYDRNDQVFIDDVQVWGVHGRALYAGVCKHEPAAYMRESHLRSLRFFKDGAPGVPVVEFNSQGTADGDGTNEIAISQLDIFGPAGPGMVIRNNGGSGVRDFTIEALRIEGWQSGTGQGDLLTIGDARMRGNVNNVRLTDVELIDPQAGYAALRLTAAPGAEAPYQVTFGGLIGGGAPRGEGLRIDAGRTSVFRFSGIHSFGTNVVVGRGVSQVVLDGGGQEARWSFRVDRSSAMGVSFPVIQNGLGQR